MSSGIIVAHNRPLHEQLRRLAGEARMIFVAGLPGMGKSLVIHQLAHLAVAGGRLVHLLQWDVARPVVEASPAGRRYPVVNGVTHPAIRKAVGLWARQAVGEWERRWSGPEHLLVGETPLVGGRLSELAHVAVDAAEAILATPSCIFALPVPSAEVRRVLESERERRVVAPLHPREVEDAPPRVLRDLWVQLVGLAPALGISEEASHQAVYDARLYRRVYETVLRHRHVEVVALDTVLPTAAFSVYDFGVVCRDLVPSAADVETLIREVERRYPDSSALAGGVERWWAS